MPTVNPISAVSAGGNVTAPANATGGNGAAGNDNATGGAGANASLTDKVSGTTAGNVTLNQTAIGGNGGAGVGAAVAAAGNEASMLTYSHPASGQNDGDEVRHGWQRWRGKRRRRVRRCGGHRDDASRFDGCRRRHRNGNRNRRQRRRDLGQLDRQRCRRRRSDGRQLGYVDGIEYGFERLGRRRQRWRRSRRRQHEWFRRQANVNPVSASFCRWKRHGNGQRHGGNGGAGNDSAAGGNGGGAS